MNVKDHSDFIKKLQSSVNNQGRILQTTVIQPHISPQFKFEETEDNILEFKSISRENSAN